jgi:hypothetical protein
MSDEAISEVIEEVVPDEPVKKGRGKREKVKKEKVKKKGKGKLLIILSLAFLLLGGGGFAAAAFMGLIPGLKLGAKPVAKKQPEKETPAKEAAPAVSTAPVAQPPTAPVRPIREVSPEPETPKKKVPAVTIDPEKGAKAIARIWEKMEPEKLAEIAATYRDLELARVLRGMETKKAAALLGQLPADRAAKLSQEMEKLASRATEGSGT